ncbi:cytochrome P450 [Xylaria scruposa]|nr:cytochrome P450 [Xylaria scruposa]
MDVFKHLGGQPLTASLQVLGVTLALGFLFLYFNKDRPYPGFPLAVVEGKSPKESWLYHGKQTLSEGSRKYSGAFQVITGTGPVIVLPNRFADELRNHHSLSFMKGLAKDFFINYPGFEAHRSVLKDPLLAQETVRIQLTQSLGLITGDLVEETTATLQEVIGDSDEWQVRRLKDDVSDIVARLSARVFLGLNLCRNKRWLDISKTYTTDLFITSYIMRMAPAILRPIVYWIIPQARSIRKAVRDAHEIIDPEVERRKKAIDAAHAAGEKPPKTADALGWMYESAKRRNVQVEYSNASIAMAMAAIHTTSETLSQALLDICQYPDVADQLRKEIVEVIGQNGWSKTSLYKLRLMDSFLKEGQRHHPMSAAAMGRYVENSIELSDGTILPRCSRIMVAGNFMDPEIYTNPSEFDAARFCKLRQRAGEENRWQFVTTTPAYTLFGHGEHACPGRFFASNELKIALCHLLIKYDWDLIPGEGRPKTSAFEASDMVDTAAKLRVRRRRAEIDLDTL